MPRPRRRNPVRYVDDDSEAPWMDTPQDRHCSKEASALARMQVTLVASAATSGGAIGTEAPLYLGDANIYDRAKCMPQEDPTRERGRRAVASQVAHVYDADAIVRDALAASRTHDVLDTISEAESFDPGVQAFQDARRELFTRLFAELTDEDDRGRWLETTVDCACCDMSEAELVQQALLHKRKLSVERKNRKREAEAKRKRAIAKARATKGATPSDIKRVAAARGFVVTDDEVRRMFSVFPAARPKASVDALRTFFAAETAEARRTGAHSYKPPADPDLKWILLALDAAAAGSKDLSQAAAEADELSHDVVTGARIVTRTPSTRRLLDSLADCAQVVTAPGRRRWLARAKEEWLDFESVSKSAFVATLDSSQVCRSREDLQKAHATFKSGSPSVQRRFVRTYDWLTPLVDELVGAEDSMMFPLVNYALEQVVGENRQETLFDERRLTRDASTAEFYESLFGADEEDDALTKKCRGGSFLKQEPVTPLSPTKTSCF